MQPLGPSSSINRNALCSVFLILLAGCNTRPPVSAGPGESSVPITNRNPTSVQSATRPVSPDPNETIGAQKKGADTVTVEDILKRVTKSYQQLDALHVKAQVKIKGEGADYVGIERYELKFKTPNNIWCDWTMISEDGRKVHRQIACDGKSLWRWSGETNRYSCEMAPQSVAGINELPQDVPEIVLLTGGESFQGADSAMLRLDKPGTRGGVQVYTIKTNRTEVVEHAVDHPVTEITLFVGMKDSLLRGMLAKTSFVDPATKKKLGFSIDAGYLVNNPSVSFDDSAFVFIPPPGSKPR